MKKVSAIKFCLLAVCCFIAVLCCGSAVLAAEGTKAKVEEKSDIKSKNERVINLLTNVLKSLESAVTDLFTAQILLPNVRDNLNKSEEYVLLAAKDMSEIGGLANNALNNATNAHQNTTEASNTQLGGEEIKKNLNNASQTTKELLNKLEKFKLGAVKVGANINEISEKKGVFSLLPEEEKTKKITEIKEEIKAVETELNETVQTTTETMTVVWDLLLTAQKLPEEPVKTEDTFAQSGGGDEKKHSKTEEENNNNKVASLGSETGKNKEEIKTTTEQNQTEELLLSSSLDGCRNLFFWSTFSFAFLYVFFAWAATLNVA